MIIQSLHFCCELAVSGNVRTPAVSTLRAGAQILFLGGFRGHNFYFCTCCFNLCVLGTLRCCILCCFGSVRFQVCVLCIQPANHPASHPPSHASHPPSQPFTQPASTQPAMHPDTPSGKTSRKMSSECRPNYAPQIGSKVIVNSNTKHVKCV